jgi:hypothetical protein
VRIKFGTKAWSLLASLAFSLVVWAGCNTEEPAATTPASSPAPAAAKPAPPTPPPSPATKGEDATKKAP